MASGLDQIYASIARTQLPYDGGEFLVEPMYEFSRHRYNDMIGDRVGDR